MIAGLLLAKPLGILAASLGGWALYKYIFAIFKWNSAKGQITGYEKKEGNLSMMATLLVVKFLANDGREYEVRSSFYIPFIHSLYKIGSQAAVRYPSDSPDEAMLQSLAGPLGYIVMLVLGGVLLLYG